MENLWVEVVGNLIIARVRGVPNREIIKECQDRVLQIARDSQLTRVLYDSLETEAPPADVPLSQAQLDQTDDVRHLKRAVVVANTKLAYLSRIAFGEGKYRVFYNDMSAAIQWLNQDS